MYFHNVYFYQETFINQFTLHLVKEFRHSASSNDLYLFKESYHFGFVKMIYIHLRNFIILGSSK